MNDYLKYTFNVVVGLGFSVTSFEQFLRILLLVVTIVGTVYTAFWKKKRRK